MPNSQPEFKVLYDTREQHPWEFRRGNGCLGTERRTLKTGDYTLEGYEGVLALEKKATPAEIAGNVFQSRFSKALERLSAYPVARVVCEFDLAAVQAFPQGSDIPASRRGRVKVRGPLLQKRLNELELEFPAVRWVFAGSPEAARAYARSLFKRVVERFPRA